MHGADTSLVVAELPTANGCVLGTLTLNVESSLNSLTLEMIRAMTAALSAWRSRDDIAAIVLTGRGPTAVCAGGDATDPRGDLSRAAGVERERRAAGGDQEGGGGVVPRRHVGCAPHAA